MITMMILGFFKKIWDFLTGKGTGKKMNYVEICKDPECECQEKIIIKDCSKRKRKWYYVSKRKNKQKKN
tara:strand:+ start:594 stop:800 length:207 start_codon:yes stop_codon:yes gene_type:complete